MLTKIKNTGTLLAMLGLLVLFAVSPLWAEESDPATKQDDTMLLFVGEDVEVLSIASRREESAWQAPAIANVITRQAIRERGEPPWAKP